jgi:tetratricopeptide (TPR) repeat protein
MLQEIKKLIIQWVINLARILDSPSPSLPTTVPEYQKALASYRQDNPQTLLALLLARDRVESCRIKQSPLTLDVINSLAQLDQQTIKIITYELGDSKKKDSISKWRRTYQPPKGFWWWYLDKEVADEQKERDILWEALTVALFISTATLATDIIRRLWAHTPDNWAIFGTILTLLITASPFTKNGREYLQWLLRRIPRLSTRHHSKIATATAFVSLLFIAILRFAYLPNLAQSYNSRGVDALQNGHLNTARQYFQRAIAIDNNLAASYYNLAAGYEKIARYDESIAWYERAMDYDLQFAPAYNNLGRIYLLRNDPVKAQEVLTAGLLLLGSTDLEQEVTIVTRYRILTHLGQAYYEQGQFSIAALTLEETIAIETGGELNSQFFASRPHYYLALTYEALSRPSEEIIRQWEMALGYLSTEDPVTWRTIITQQLGVLRKGEAE